MDHLAAQVIIDMYSNAATALLVNGEAFDGFEITSGVRQGCLLSGSFFVLLFHTWLCEVDVQISTDSLRMTIKLRLYAFADDLAILAAKLWTTVQFLPRLFALFEAAVHAKIKPVRSVIIPLWLNPDVKATSRRLALLSQAWGALKVRLEAVYLGVKIGPLATNANRWANPFRAFASPGYFFAALGAGWVTLACFCNVALASLLGFAAQR